MEITNKKYNELMEAEMMLNSLYGAGVDNWDGWDIAMELFEEMKRMYIPLDTGEE
jgi:hypothetical protein